MNIRSEMREVVTYGKVTCRCSVCVFTADILNGGNLLDMVKKLSN